MKNIVLAALVAVGAFAAVPPADARQGCGIGFHRGPYGGCRPNLRRGPVVRGPVVIVPAAPAVGVFYRGRGWWDGRRYRANRYRWHGGWRYR